MNDRLDLDKVKGWIKESKESGFPMLRADVAFIFFDRLVREVEKGESVFAELRKKNISLIKERNKYRQKLIDLGELDND